METSTKPYVCIRKYKTNREDSDERAAVAYGDIAGTRYSMNEGTVCRVWLLGLAPARFLVDWRDPSTKFDVHARKMVKEVKGQLIDLVKERCGAL